MKLRSSRAAAVPFVLCFSLLATACSPAPAGVSGTFEARRTVVSSEIAARIEQIDAREGDSVAPGQPLALLDCDIPRAQLAQALANLELAQARLQAIRDGARTQEIASAEAQLEIARQQLALARRGATDEQEAQLQAALTGVSARIALASRNVERAEALVSAGSAPESNLDAARAELDVLHAERARIEAQLDEARRGARSEERAVIEQRVVQAEQQLALLREGARTSDIAAAESQVRAAEAGVAMAEAQVERCTILAPVSGVIDIVAREVGESVSPGAHLFAIGHDGPLVLRSWAPQSALGGTATGTEVEIRVDGAGGEPVRGRVLRIYEEAEFTPGNVQTPEDRALLVFRVDIEVPREGPVPVRPGMSAVVLFPGAAP